MAEQKPKPQPFVPCPKRVYRGFNCLVPCRLVKGHDGRCE